MSNKTKIIRCATVHTSIPFVKGMIPYLSNKYELVLLSSPGECLTNISEEFGVRHYGVSMARRMAPFKDLVSLWHLCRVFRKEKPKMIHSMTPKAGLLCMMAGKLTGVPIRVHTFTGLVWPTATGIKRSLLMFTDRLTCACATHIIPEGQGVLNDLANNKITTKPLKVLGYGNIQGIDLVRFDKIRVKKRSEELKLQYELGNVFTFIFVGRVVKDKGINELVDAFVRLQQVKPNVRLLLIGKIHTDIDPISKKTKSLIESCNAIMSLGEIFGDDLIAHYALADCLVFPSYREGFPNTVIEAGAMGLPCIVTDINGSREIIENKKNGLIIPSKDSEALLDAMEKIIDDESLRFELARNSRPMISSRFDCHFVRQCLYDYYDMLLC